MERLALQAAPRPVGGDAKSGTRAREFQRRDESGDVNRKHSRLVSRPP
jgi:hypothetical protein